MIRRLTTLRARRAAAVAARAEAAKRRAIEAVGAEAERERTAAFIDRRAAAFAQIAMLGGRRNIGRDEAAMLARHLTVIAQDVRIGLHDDREPSDG